MAFVEKRGKNSFRVHFKLPDGTWDKKSTDEFGRSFASEDDAKAWGQAQEVDIRRGVWRDPEKGKIILQEWVDAWWPAQDLALKTRHNYSNVIIKHILPFFGSRALNSITPVEVAAWERKILAAGYSASIAKGARARLITILGDAVLEGHIQANPALRPRKRGRKVAVAGRAALKAWATPLQVLLLAERAAILSGRDDEFYAVLTLGYTGMRWSEMTGLTRDHVKLSGVRLQSSSIRVDWQVIEDPRNGLFYRLQPKDASHRDIDIPVFLAELLSEWIQLHPAQRCECNGGPPHSGGELPCKGGLPLVWLGPGRTRYVVDGSTGEKEKQTERGHIRASKFLRSIWAPAVDGRHSGRRRGTGRRVLVDVFNNPDETIFPGAPRHPWPGTPRYPWPDAEKGKPFTPPSGRGIQVYDEDRHQVACWLPLVEGLTPHGLRHGMATWAAEDRIDEKLRDERMGHVSSGMRTHYTKITDEMRRQLRDALQARWERSLAERAAISTVSPVPALERLLKPFRKGTKRPISQTSPRRSESPLQMISGEGM